MPARFGDAFFGVEKSLHRGCAQHANGFGLNRHQLAEQKLSADFHFIGLRRAVFRRPAFHHIADVDVGALELNAFFAAVFSIICVNNWPARPTNGMPCASSSAPGPSPTNTSGERFVPIAKDDFVARFAEAAAFAIADVGADFGESVAGGGEGG